MMSTAPLEDGLRVVTDDEPTDREALAAEDGARRGDPPLEGDLGSLRDAFVEAFNSRDIDELLGLVRADVECPDAPGADGKEAFAEEVHAIWDRSPEAFLTRAFLDDTAVAVAWRPDEEGRWTRVALVCFDVTDGLLSLVTLPDDVDALERAVADDPTDAELEEWNDWAEWDRGEETVAPDPDRSRP
jgi:hypothetical protein